MTGIASCLIGASSAYAPYVLELSAVGGESFWVMPDELVRGYNKYLTDSLSINVKSENTDGSIGVRHPRFMFAGELLPYASCNGFWHSEQDCQEHENWVCRMLGFSEAQGVDNTHGNSQKTIKYSGIQAEPHASEWTINGIACLP